MKMKYLITKPETKRLKFQLLTQSDLFKDKTVGSFFGAKEKIMGKFERKFSGKKIILLLYFFLTLTTISVKGQQNNKIVDGYSINPKIGFYNGFKDDAGFNGGAELNVLKNKIIYSANFYRYEEFVIFGPQPAEHFNQIGVMIGRYKGEKIFRFQVQVGLASLWGLKRTELIHKGSGIFSSDEYDSKHFFTVGLITKIGFKVIPLPFLAIGIDLQRNINLENMIYTPMISIEIGKLRSKKNKP